MPDNPEPTQPTVQRPAGQFEEKGIAVELIGAGAAVGSFALQAYQTFKPEPPPPEPAQPTPPHIELPPGVDPE